MYSRKRTRRAQVKWVRRRIVLKKTITIIDPSLLSYLSGEARWGHVLRSQNKRSTRLCTQSFTFLSNLIHYSLLDRRMFTHATYAKGICKRVGKIWKYCSCMLVYLYICLLFVYVFAYFSYTFAYLHILYKWNKYKATNEIDMKAMYTCPLTSMWKPDHFAYRMYACKNMHSKSTHYEKDYLRFNKHWKPTLIDKEWDFVSIQDFQHSTLWKFRYFGINSSLFL